MASDATTVALRAPQYLRRYFDETGREYATGHNVKCPNKSAHSHGDTNPSAKIYENADGAIVKCYGCGFTGDIFKLWQMDNGGTFKDAKAALCERYGLGQQSGGGASIGAAKKSGAGARGVPSPEGAKPSGGVSSVGTSSGADVQGRTVTAKPDAETMAYLIACGIAYQAGEDEAGRAYLRGRGISDETARRFGIGYDANAKAKYPTFGNAGAIVIPQGSGCALRSISPSVTQKDKVRFYPSKMPRVLFNGAAMVEAAKNYAPVFIVEGEIDALSVAEAGAVAVSCGGTSGIGKVVNAVRSIGRGLYVPCMDRDTHGEEAQAKVADELKQIGGGVYVYADAPVMLMPDAADGTHPKDANEALQQDAAAFKARVAEVVAKATAYADAERKSNAPTYTFADIPEPPPEEKNPRALFKGGYLRKGGGIIAASVAGAGKSTFSIQCALHWVMGFPCFGITPVRPLRIVIIQAEDDIEELAMFKENMRKGLTDEGWNAEQIERAFARLMFRKDFLGLTGEDFAAGLRSMQSEEHYDLVIVNPLNSYFEGDISLNADATQFFRKMIDPVIKSKSTECGVLFIHHSGKPPKGKDAASFGKGAFAQYSIQGAAELNNWARAVLVLYPFENNTEFWTLTAAKRHRPLGWKDAEGKPTKDFVIAYSSNYVYWRVPSAEEVTEARSGVQSANPAKVLISVPDMTAKIAEHYKKNFPKGIPLTKAREVALGIAKGSVGGTAYGGMAYEAIRKNPDLYGFDVVLRDKKHYFIPKPDTLFDGVQSEPTKAQAEQPDEDGADDADDGDFDDL